MKYFDAHCHIQFPEYDGDRIAVLERMKDAQVGGLVVGVDEESSQAAVTLVESHKNTTPMNLFASVGLHPNDISQSNSPFDVSVYEKLASRPEVRAIGECGLDYYRPEDLSDALKKRQRDIFEQQIELAVGCDKPLMIHSRPSKGSQDAYLDTINIIRAKKQEYGEKLRANMHFFVGGIEEARAFVELDFTLSYTAVITFANEYDQVIRYIPLSNLLSETDSPFIAPAQNRGRRNEPVAVKEVIKAIARIRGENEEMVREEILHNAARVFNFSLL